MDAIFNRLIASRMPTVRRVFNPAYFSAAFEALRDRFETSFDAVKNDHPLNIADSWNFMYLQPRGTFQSPSTDRHLFEARAPHMDADLVAFLLTIPPYARLEQRVYKKMIAHKFPEIRDIPCTNSGRPINPAFASEYAALAFCYLARKATRPVAHWFGGGKGLGREFRDLSEDFRSEPALANLLRNLLEAGIFPSRIFNHSAIDDVIREHYELKGRHEGILSLLISYGLAAKYFLRDDLSDAPREMFVA